MTEVGFVMYPTVKHRTWVIRKDVPGSLPWSAVRSTRSVRTMLGPFETWAAAVEGINEYEREEMEGTPCLLGDDSPGPGSGNHPEG